MLFKSFTAAALLSLAQALDVQVVSVGLNPVNNATATKFYPEKITAEPGSMVQFQFWTGNHTVTQSNFDNACVPLSTSNASAVGIDSSWMPVADSKAMGQIPVFTIMVNDTKPLWFYCKTGAHCQSGMSMVINENTAANASRSLEEYKTLSEGATGGAAGGDASGGAGGAAGGESNSNKPPPDSAASTLAISNCMLLVAGAAFLLL